MSTIQLRDYQLDPVHRVMSAHKGEKSRIVLAASTGSGKTEMAISIIENFVSKGLGKVLVIAHHTHVIKSNFLDRLVELKPNFTFSDVSSDVDCFVTIRSNSLLTKIDPMTFDLIIVDEAHQNYFAPTIQSVLGHINHELLLTGTPSKFIHSGGFDIIPIARLNIPSDYFASLSFRVINAETSIVKEDYNQEGVVKSSKNFNRTEIRSMCDSVIPHLDEGKKLFICKDIEQADLTAQYLCRVGIPTITSDSESDLDGRNIELFKSGMVTSICVVDRMRVGYSDNDLYHTVDMSFTHNPDVILQILSRSNRGVPSQKKQYIKVTNNALNTRSRFMLSIALGLFKEENMLAYNGINIRNLTVPVQKQASKSSRKSSTFDTNQFFIPDSVDVHNFFESCDFVNTDFVIKKLSGFIDYEHCVKVIVSGGYTNYTTFRRDHRGCDHFLTKNDLVTTICKETSIKPPNRRRTSFSIDEMIKLASNYDSVGDFNNYHRTFFVKIKEAGRLDELVDSNGLPLNKKTGPMIGSIQKVCMKCGTSYLAKRKISRFCSRECQAKSLYDRKKL